MFTVYVIAQCTNVFSVCPALHLRRGKQIVSKLLLRRASSRLFSSLLLESLTNVGCYRETLLVRTRLVTRSLHWDIYQVPELQLSLLSSDSWRSLKMQQVTRWTL